LTRQHQRQPVDRGNHGGGRAVEWSIDLHPRHLAGNRFLPKDFPPFTTIQNRFYAWRDSGLWPQIISVLVMAAREADGREPAPTAVVVDSQSVKTTEAGGPRGFDAGKKIKGRKRHVAVDTLGLPIECQVTAASVQDRDPLAPLLGAVHRKSPWVTMSFVDGGYQGDEAQRADGLRHGSGLRQIAASINP
jgi:transposase